MLLSLGLDMQILGKMNFPSPCKWEFLAILCPHRKIQVRSLSWELWHATNCTWKANSGKHSPDSHTLQASAPWDSAGAATLVHPAAEHLPGIRHSLNALCALFCLTSRGTFSPSETQGFLCTSPHSSSSCPWRVFHSPWMQREELRLGKEGLEHRVKDQSLESLLLGQETLYLNYPTQTLCHEFSKDQNLGWWW